VLPCCVLPRYPLLRFCHDFLQISRVQKMLGDEYGTASNIKSRVNRLSVLGAITSAQQRLKLYNKVRLQELVSVDALYFLVLGLQDSSSFRSSALQNVQQRLKLYNKVCLQEPGHVCRRVCMKCILVSGLQAVLSSASPCTTRCA
jgi:hypothetical protein